MKDSSPSPASPSPARSGLESDLSPSPRTPIPGNSLLSLSVVVLDQLVGSFQEGSPSLHNFCVYQMITPGAAG